MTLAEQAEAKADEMPLTICDDLYAWGMETQDMLRQLAAALREREGAQQAGQVPNWREHVEQRIRTWRQSTMNKSGDRLAIDDFMDQDSIDDLVDFVCDEWSEPAASTWSGDPSTQDYSSTVPQQAGQVPMHDVMRGLPIRKARDVDQHSDVVLVADLKCRATTMLAAAPEAPAQPEQGERILAYLDDLKDDAAAHIWPDDLEKCQTSECVVEVYSVRMGSPDGKTVPLFSREQVAEAIARAASAQAKKPMTPESWEEIEAVIACLGDDAAQLRDENAEDERAANMERAAELLAFAYGITGEGA